MKVLQRISPGLSAAILALSCLLTVGFTGAANAVGSVTASGKVLTSASSLTAYHDSRHR